MSTILSRNYEFGQSLFDFYDKNQILERKHRDMLCSMIVDYYLKEKNVKPTSKQIQSIADEIVLCFPSENSVSY